MSPSPRVDHAHSRQEAQSSELAMAPRAKPVPWPGVIAVLVAMAAVAGSGWLYLGSEGSASGMSVVFQGRNFDKAGLRAAIAHLKQSGIVAVPGSRGELLIAPERLQEAQASLEKAGLKPLTLEEIRNAPGETLSILESPEQRDQRRRIAREKELAWHIERLDEVADAHVGLEPQAGGSRWIGRRDPVRHHVRVFVEPEEPLKGLSEEAVKRIEQLILASLPNANSGLLTIHDARRVYRMAIQGDSDVSSQRVRPDSAESEMALASKIQKTIPEIGSSQVRVSLRQVEEGSGRSVTPSQTTEPTAPRLYFNRPVAISETDSVQPERSARTQRARIQILPLPELASAFESSDLRRQIRDRISKAISPILVEQIDWLSSPGNSVAGANGAPGKSATEPKRTDPAQKPYAANPERPLTPIGESTRLALSPWVIGGIAIAMAAGALVLGRSLWFGSSTDKTAYVNIDESADWVRNLAASGEDVLVRGPHDLPADKAAEVLSSWLDNIEERDRDGE